MLHVNSMSVFGESHLLCDVMLHVNSMSECQCLVKVICCDVHVARHRQNCCGVNAVAGQNVIVLSHPPNVRCQMSFRRAEGHAMH